MLAQRDRIAEIAASCNASEVSLFGSTARGEDTEESDCDFLAVFAPGTTLVHVARMSRELGELLGCRADVVSVGSLPEGVSPADVGAVAL